MMREFRLWTLDFGRWTWDLGLGTLDMGHGTLDRGRWVRLTLAVTLGALLGCQSNQSEQPSISDAKIARIMADISIADAATTGLAGYAKDSLMQVYFKQVFEMHGVTLESYEKDLRILAQDLPRMEAIVKEADELLSGTGKIKDGGSEN